MLTTRFARLLKRNMSYVKTQQEIEDIREGGRLLGIILDEVAGVVEPGVMAYDIDVLAEKLIRAVGARPSFKGYRASRHDPKFPNTVCTSLNDEVVHGFALKEKVFRNGDILSIDIGMEWPLQKSRKRGFFTDTALTIAVGDISKERQGLMDVTAQALEAGIRACQVGNTVGDIGRAIELYVKGQGRYGIVRDLVGHGVGHGVHEEPRIPNYYEKELDSWILEPGVVIAIEPMITTGDWHIRVDGDAWTIRTADGSDAAHFEHTVIIQQGGPNVATRRPSELKSGV